MNRASDGISNCEYLVIDGKAYAKRDWHSGSPVPQATTQVASATCPIHRLARDNSDLSKCYSELDDQSRLNLFASQFDTH